MLQCAAMDAYPETTIWLASASPRRAELMRRLGLAYRVQAADVDESALPGEGCEDYVQRLALAKARAVHESNGGWVIGADTSVLLDGEIIGKPADMAQARAMRARLAGRAHLVATAVALVGPGCAECMLDVSTVHFGPMDSADIQMCCDQDQPLDKAGGYAIQGCSAAFVRRLEGSPSGVMGLPLHPTAELLRKHGLYPPPTGKAASQG